jgi:TonB-linked SusC/RagA family outer membrane protein
MKKKRTFHGLFGPWTKLFLVMRLSIFLFFAFIFASQAKSFSQSSILTLNVSQARLIDVLTKIEEQTDYYFYYNLNLEDYHVKNIKAKNQNVKDVLDLLLPEMGLNYEIVDRYIVIKRADDNNQLKTSFISQQKKPISGKVTDTSGNSLPGVSVVVRGTTNGTITDVNGNYSLSYNPENSALQFSFVGMKTQEVAIDGKATINVTLEEDAIGLEEVVAVGYGSQKKRDVIGSIATVKAETLETTSSSTNVLSLLQGQAAGVSIQSTSGKLGAGVNILIRGLSSISAGTSPLYIIDGVPVIGDMSLINQTDIESIQVLKDAAATSIYGSRGSNGVVLITTKSGVAGKPTISLDYSTGVSDLPFQQVKLINTKQLFEMLDFDKSTNSTGNFDIETDYYSSQSYITEKLTRDQALATNTDWQKVMMRKGSYQNANLSVVGGDKIARYFVSGNYRKDEGVTRNDALERYGVRANVDLKPSNHFDVGVRINLDLAKRTQSGASSFNSIFTAPALPVYSLANPTLYLNPKAGNPAASNDRANNMTDIDTYRALVGVFGEYHIPFIKGLSARTEVSMDFQQENSNHWESAIIRQDGYSAATDNANTSKTSNYNFYLTYNTQFGDHSLNVVGGMEGQRTTGWYRTLAGRDLVGIYQELGTPNQKTSMTSTLGNENYRLGYFGRANYKFKEKYMAGFSIRRDGSSVFTPTFRWGNFMAFSAGWILTDEPFMGNFGKNHFLKIRGSFGQTGNSNITSKLDANGYTNALAYGSSDITATNGTQLNSLGVNNLTWETTSSSDFGVDFAFFNNRINGSVAYYNKYVKDLLLSVALPPSSGVNSGSLWNNIGDLVNNGFELSVTSVNIRTKKFKWQTTLNIASNHNEVKKLTPQIDAKGTGMVSSAYITKVGSGIRDYFLADFAGIDPQSGLPKIYALDKDYYKQTGETRRLKDASGNDILLNANANNVGSNYFHLKNKNGIPKYYGGITNQFTYKAFDFSFLVTFSGGNYIYDQYLRQITSNLGGNLTGIPVDYYNNYWKKPGDNAKYMRLLWRGNVYKDENGVVQNFGDARSLSTQYLFKGDFVKLKSVTIGYTLPMTSKTKNVIQELRLYANVENLYTLTKYPGWDPEGQSYMNDWVLPQLFSASFGVSVKF